MSILYGYAIARGDIDRLREEVWGWPDKETALDLAILQRKSIKLLYGIDVNYGIIESEVIVDSKGIYELSDGNHANIAWVGNGICSGRVMESSSYPYQWYTNGVPMNGCPAQIKCKSNKTVEDWKNEETK